MITTNTNFDAKHNVDYKTPLYLVHFDSEGVDYCNHVPASPDNTCKKYLISISGLSQQDVPEEGQSTIDGVTIELLDKNNEITALWATDTNSYFHRRKTTIKAGYMGMAEADMLTILPAGYITGMRYSNTGGSWVLQITDPRKYFDRKIFRGSEDTAITLSGNPLTIFLSILLSSGTPGTNHAFYDQYAEGVGLDLTSDEINISQIETLRETWYPGSSHYMAFTIDGRETAMSWFRKEIFKPLNLRPGVDGNGKIILRKFQPPLVTSAETQSFNKDNIIGLPQYDANLSETINEVQFDYDHDGSDYLSSDFFIDTTSLANRGPGKKQLKIQSKGLHTSFAGRSFPGGNISKVVEARANSIFARYADPPVKIVCECLFSRWLSEAGDIVEFTHEDLPNLTAGTLGYSNTRMEILSRRIDWIRGRVFVTLLDTGFDKGVYGVISPTMTVTAGTDGQHFTVSAADAAKFSGYASPVIEIYDSGMRHRGGSAAAITSISTSSGSIVCGSLGVTPAAGDKAVFANYDDCTSTQQLYGFIADSSDHLGSSDSSAILISP